MNTISDYLHNRKIIAAVLIAAVIVIAVIIAVATNSVRNVGSQEKDSPYGPEPFDPRTIKTSLSQSTDDAPEYDPDINMDY